MPLSDTHVVVLGVPNELVQVDLYRLSTRNPKISRISPAKSSKYSIIHRFDLETQNSTHRISRNLIIST